jgi:hypothetical protein
MEYIHLYVEICSDGTLMAYDSDRKLNRLFTDVISWHKLDEIYKLSKLPSNKRKGLDREFNIKYIKYYFKNTKTGDIMEIPEEHIINILSNIK